MSRVFTEEELSLMKQLGLTVAQVEVLARTADRKIQRESRRKNNTFMSEYFLMHTDVCSLCSGAFVTYFKMTREYSSAGEYLHSMPITREEFLSAESKISKEAKHLTCKHCTENLSKLSQAQLVSLAITLQRRMIK